MFSEIQWLFFDIGSTLVNEEKVYKDLIKRLSIQSNISYEVIDNMILSSYKNNENGIEETIKRLDVSKPKWESNLEYLYDDAYLVLKNLHSKYKIGIIANQKLGLNERLENMGIAQFIDLVVYSSEEGIKKPDVRLFEIALSRSHCKAQNAVMIGDRIDNDIYPANKLGMATIWIKQGYGKYWNIRTDEK